MEKTRTYYANNQTYTFDIVREEKVEKSHGWIISACSSKEKNGFRRRKNLCL